MTPLALCLCALLQSADDTPRLMALYQKLHAAPELSLFETSTAAFLADEMKAQGFTVTTQVGGHGVVAVLENGPGPRVLVRCDMDALPVLEATGLPYASKATAELDGRSVPVMHACGHDVHMTVWLGTAAALARARDRWQGTLVFIAQPAEEKGLGAQAMLAAGLFSRFGKPDHALALHVSPWHAAGTVAVTPGYALANSESCDVVFKGRGGHGSAPHTTIDPITIAARFVLAIQTLISREKDPRAPGVISVGAIHGGLKHNIIPDEVSLKLTLRSYDDAVHQALKDGIVRIAKAEALAANAPEPAVSFQEAVQSVRNDQGLSERLLAMFRKELGEPNATTAEPVMAAEDFGRFGRAGIPACLFWLGAVEPGRLADSKKSGGAPLPGLHSATFAPDAERTVRTGVRAMTTAVAGLLSPTEGTRPMNLYSLKTTSLEGQPVDLSQYQGKVTLVVNVASECGYTPQYTGLQALHAELKGRGFAVLGFPSNDFGSQEPGTPQEIRTFCTKTYHVDFPMLAKVVTKAGAGQSEVYQLLGKAAGKLPKWNFCKYLVGKDGAVLQFFDSKVKPEDPALREAIEKALR
jgi:amidohydrolase